MQADGAVVITGLAAFPNGHPAASCSRACAATAVPDTSFSDNGRFNGSAPPGATLANANALAITSDGRILGAGTAFIGASDRAFDVELFTPEGARDTSFGTAGRLVTRFAGAATLGAMVLDQRPLPNLITAAGQLRTPASVFFGLARYAFNCLICNRFTLSPSGTISATLGAPAPVGILVERVRAGRVTRVGRVPLGRHAAGRLRLHWDLAVRGRSLAPGRYRVTLRALRGRRVLARSKPVTLRVLR